MSNALTLVCAKCGHNGFTVAAPPEPKDAAPGQVRKLEFPTPTAAEAQIQEKLKRMEDCIKRDVGERVLSGIDPSVLGRLAAFHTRLERLEKDQKWYSEHVKKIEAEISRIGTRQFDTGRRLEIVSESCAAARKEARQARWLAFLLAVVVLGLLCGFAFGEAA